MRLLAIDLAWDGPSGWVVWDDSGVDPIYDYGEFKPKVPSKLKETDRLQQLVFEISHNVASLLTLYSPDFVAYEETDWHQSLQKRSDWKQKYAQERTVQRCLGRAEGSLLLTCRLSETRCVGIGARECKQEFAGSSVITKENIAWTFKDTYNQEFKTRFELTQNLPVKETALANEHYIFDTFKRTYISHHISDAFVIAYVVARRERQKQLVQESQLRQTKT